MARFVIVANVMLAFLVVSLSDAASERAFSMARKIETYFMSELVHAKCALLSV